VVAEDRLSLVAAKIGASVEVSADAMQGSAVTAVLAPETSPGLAAKPAPGPALKACRVEFALC